MDKLRGYGLEGKSADTPWQEHRSRLHQQYQEPSKPLLITSTSRKCDFTSANIRNHSDPPRPRLHVPLCGTLLHLANTAYILAQHQGRSKGHQSARPRRSRLLHGIYPDHSFCPRKLWQCINPRRPAAVRHLAIGTIRLREATHPHQRPLCRPALRTDPRRCRMARHHMGEHQDQILDLTNRP